MDVTHYQITIAGSPGSSYSQSAMVIDEKPSRTPHDEWEKEIWKKKMHFSPDGRLVIPGTAFKRSLEDGAKYLGITVPGKGRRQFGSLFKSAVIIPENLTTDVTEDQIYPATVFVNPQGIRGGGSRVAKIFPQCDAWRATGSLIVTDAAITEEILKQHIQAAGLYIGLGRWRIEKGGMNGRFVCEAIKKEVVKAAA